MQATGEITSNNRQVVVWHSSAAHQLLALQTLALSKQLVPLFTGAQDVLSQKYRYMEFRNLQIVAAYFH